MRSCKLWIKYKDYLIYDNDGEELGLRDDAPPEAKEAYAKEKKILESLEKAREIAKQKGVAVIVA